MSQARHSHALSTSVYRAAKRKAEPHSRGALSYRAKRQVKRLIGRRLEHKYFDFGFGATGFATTPQPYNLSLIPQGVADQQRVGDSVDLKKLTVRMQFVGGDIYNTVRIILFRFKQDTASAAPVAADIYDTTAAGAEYVMCPTPALEHQDKIKIIWDKVVTLPQTNYYTTSSQITNTSNSVKTWKQSFYGRRLGSKKIRFNPGATSGYNHIYMMIVTDSSIAPSPQIYLNSRVEYTDA